MDSKSEVDWGAMPSRYMRTASEMKAMQDEADTFSKEMMDKLVKQMGEAHARHMEKVTVNTMMNNTPKRPLQFQSGDPAGDPYPHTTGGHTAPDGQGHVHTIPTFNGEAPPPDPTGGAMGAPTWTEAEIKVLVTDLVNEAVAHLVSELDGMTQRCQELEIELEITKNEFHDQDFGDVLPKHRGLL